MNPTWFLVPVACVVVAIGAIALAGMVATVEPSAPTSTETPKPMSTAAA